MNGVVIVLLGLAIEIEVFFLCYFLRRLNQTPQPLPPAQMVRRTGQHPGFRLEPSWLRPVEAFVLATGLTAMTMTALCFLGILGMYFLL